MRKVVFGGHKMFKIFAYSTFGWLVLSGILHFAIDVASQYIRGVRTPGTETTLYYGLHTSYAASLLLVGGFGVLMTAYAQPLLKHWPVTALLATAYVIWFAIGFAFIEYREPKIMLGIGCALFLAMLYTSS